jgi:hypothetical protein
MNSIFVVLVHFPFARRLRARLKSIVCSPSRGGAPLFIGLIRAGQNSAISTFRESEVPK